MTMHQVSDSDFAALEGVKDRRKDDAVILHIKDLQAATKELAAKMNYHHAIFREEVEKSVERVYVSAFPDGDPTGHRLHHELVIRREEERVKFWQEMRVAGAKWLGLGVLTFLAGAAWTQFLKGPHA